MKKKDILKQLNNLQEKIKPDQAWQKSNREILRAQITAQVDLSQSQNLSHAIMNKFIFSVMKPVGVSLMILFAATGMWLTGANATKNSMPGDMLYNLKLTGERLQVNLAMNDEKKTSLEMAFAELRINEVKQVLNSTDEKTKSNLDLTLKKFQESMNNVKSNLSKLEMTDKTQALKVAALVDEKAMDYADVLRSGNIANDKTTTDAIIVSKATSDKALSVILKDFENGSSDASLDAIKVKINNRINGLKKDNEAAKISLQTIIDNKTKADAEAKAKAEADAKAAAQKASEEKSGDANKIETAQTDQKTNENTNTNTASSDAVDQSASQAETLPTIDEVKNQPAEIDKILKKAEDYVKSNSVSQAFDELSQADTMLNTINKVIDANSQYLTAPQTQSQATDAKTEDTAAKT